MNLVFDIALTHVRSRARHTMVAVVGVATGVGFSIMMAALMQGSQDDFIARMVDAIPNITVTDERREPPRQPAEIAYEVAEIRGLTPSVLRPGIKNPMAIIGSLEQWVPGAVAPSVQVKGVLRYANRDVNANITGIDSHRESRVSSLATQMREGTLASLYRTTNAIILGDQLAEKLGAKIDASITAQSAEGGNITANVVAPGPIVTSMTNDLKDDWRTQVESAVPLGRFGTAEECAAVIAFLCSDSAAYVTGAVVPVDGGLAMGH
jgi:lipoprotein-releasing system permease protein